MRYFVYILYSSELDVYYKGFSTDVEKRLEYHLNSDHKFTSKTRDWRLVYIFEYPTKTAALREEKRLKKLNRQSLEQLISKFKKNEQSLFIKSQKSLILH